MQKRLCRSLGDLIPDPSTEGSTTVVEGKQGGAAVQLWVSFRQGKKGDTEGQR